MMKGRRERRGLDAMGRRKEEEKRKRRGSGRDERERRKGETALVRGQMQPLALGRAGGRRVGGRPGVGQRESERESRPLVRRGSFWGGKDY